MRKTGFWNRQFELCLVTLVALLLFAFQNLLSACADCRQNHCLNSSLRQKEPQPPQASCGGCDSSWWSQTIVQTTLQARQTAGSPDLKENKFKAWSWMLRVAFSRRPGGQPPWTLVMIHKNEPFFGEGGAFFHLRGRCFPAQLRREQ